MPTQPPTHDTQPLLEIRSLSIEVREKPTRAEHRRVLNECSLDVRDNEILCLVGRSGAGKSLITHAIFDLLGPSTHVVGGDVLFQGQSLLRMSKKEARSLFGEEISVVSQEPSRALNPTMTLQAHFLELLSTHRGGASLSSRKSEIKEILHDVGLPSPERLLEAYPGELSGGQLQRLLIALSIILRPKLLIADEPTSSLDVTIQARILSLLSALKKRYGMSILFITHDFGVVREVADRIAVIHQGRIVESGLPDDILYEPKQKITRALLEAVPEVPYYHRVVRASDETLHLGASESVAGVSKRESPPLLSVQGLQLSRISGGFSARIFRDTRRRPILQNISFDLDQGEMLALVGESGSGKSTLARVLCGLLKADEGEIFLEGRLVNKAQEWPLKTGDIQLISQDLFFSLNPRQSAFDAVSEGPRIRGASREECRAACEQAFKMMGLHPRIGAQYPHQLSGGERQRVAIARAMAVSPKVLICDEVLSALDTLLQRKIFLLLQELQEKQKVSILFITHDLRSAIHGASRIMVMHSGRIIEAQETSELLSNPEREYTRLLLDSIPGLPQSSAYFPTEPLDRRPIQP